MRRAVGAVGWCDSVIEPLGISLEVRRDAEQRCWTASGALTLDTYLRRLTRLVTRVNLIVLGLSLYLSLYLSLSWSLCCNGAVLCWHVTLAGYVRVWVAQASIE